MTCVNTRKGKIARLPRVVRNELNRRLDNGEQGTLLVAWLNRLTETKRVLAESFEGREINEQNLTEWKAGGFQDWLAQEEVLGAAQKLTENTTGLATTAYGVRPDHLAAVLTLRTAGLLTEWDGTVTEEFERKLKALRRLSMVVLSLRRSDHAAMRMEMELIQIKEGINDGIRQSRDNEDVPEPSTGLYENLWKMAGQTFGKIRSPGQYPWPGTEPAPEDIIDEESDYNRGSQERPETNEEGSTEPTAERKNRRNKGSNQIKSGQKHRTSNIQRSTSKEGQDLGRDGGQAVEGDSRTRTRTKGEEGAGIGSDQTKSNQIKVGKYSTGRAVPALNGQFSEELNGLNKLHELHEAHGADGGGCGEIGRGMVGKGMEETG